MTRGVDLIRVARKHVGAKYVFGAVVDKANANWIGPWDCAEIVAWVFARFDMVVATNSAGDAYSGFFGDKKLDPLALPRITPEAAAAICGAVLVRSPGTGKIGHVAFSKGDGTTVEAHSSKRGVVEGYPIKGRRWDFGLLYRGVDYGATKPAIALPAVETVALGATGEVVREVQRFLKSVGISPGKIDGSFGPQTQAAVVEFQRQRGLVVDGEVGPQTAAAMAKTGAAG